MKKREIKRSESFTSVTSSSSTSSIGLRSRGFAKRTENSLPHEGFKVDTTTTMAVKGMGETEEQSSASSVSTPKRSSEIKLVNATKDRRKTNKDERVGSAKRRKDEKPQQRGHDAMKEQGEVKKREASKIPIMKQTSKEAQVSPKQNKGNTKMEAKSKEETEHSGSSSDVTKQKGKRKDGDNFIDLVTRKEQKKIVSENNVFTGELKLKKQRKGERDHGNKKTNKAKKTDENDDSSSLSSVDRYDEVEGIDSVCKPIGKDREEKQTIRIDQNIKKKDKVKRQSTETKTLLAVAGIDNATDNRQDNGSDTEKEGTKKGKVAQTQDREEKTDIKFSHNDTEVHENEREEKHTSSDDNCNFVAVDKNDQKNDNARNDLATGSRNSDKEHDDTLAANKESGQDLSSISEDKNEGFLDAVKQKLENYFNTEDKENETKKANESDSKKIDNESKFDKKHKEIEQRANRHGMKVAEKKTVQNANQQLSSDGSTSSYDNEKEEQRKRLMHREIKDGKKKSQSSTESDREVSERRVRRKKMKMKSQPDEEAQKQKHEEFGVAIEVGEASVGQHNGPEKENIDTELGNTGKIGESATSSDTDSRKSGNTNKRVVHGIGERSGSSTSEPNIADKSQDMEIENSIQLVVTEDNIASAEHPIEETNAFELNLEQEIEQQERQVDFEGLQHERIVREEAMRATEISLQQMGDEQSLNESDSSACSEIADLFVARPGLDSETCPLCKNQYEYPILLNCAHTFCRECISVLVETSNGSSFQCPECSATTKLSNEEEELFCPNFLILQEMRESHSGDSGCINCGRRKYAEVICEECVELYCKQCGDDHKQRKLNKSHKISDISTIDDISKLKKRYFCPKHKSKQLNTYCLTCGVSVCRKCAIEEHVGDDHDCGSINEAAEANRKILDNTMTLLEKQKVEVKNDADTITTIQTGLDIELDEMRDEIHKSFESLIAALHEQESKLYEEVERKYQVIRGALIEREESMSAVTKEMQNMTKFMAKLRHHENEIEMLQMAATISRRTKELEVKKYENETVVDYDFIFDSRERQIKREISRHGHIVVKDRISGREISVQGFDTPVELTSDDDNDNTRDIRAETWSPGEDQKQKLKKADRHTKKKRKKHERERNKEKKQERRVTESNRETDHNSDLSRAGHEEGGDKSTGREEENASTDGGTAMYVFTGDKSMPIEGLSKLITDKGEQVTNLEFNVKNHKNETCEVNVKMTCPDNSIVSAYVTENSEGQFTVFICPEVKRDFNCFISVGGKSFKRDRKVLNFYGDFYGMHSKEIDLACRAIGLLRWHITPGLLEKKNGTIRRSKKFLR